MTKKLPSSSAVAWHFNTETFQFLYDFWNVDRAKRIIKDKPRPISEIDIEPLRKLVGDPTKVVLLGVVVNWKKVQSDTVDLSVPVLLAYGKKGLMPIDGWHRIAKALMKGMKTLPAIKLTKEESKQCHTYTAPRRVRARTRRQRSRG